MYLRGLRVAKCQLPLQCQSPITEVAAYSLQNRHRCYFKGVSLLAYATESSSDDLAAYP